MIKSVIKHDGSIEAFDPDKLNKWSIWASKDLGESVNWSHVVIKAVSSLPEVVTSEQLQFALIKVCLDMSTWSYSCLAGKLYSTIMCKQIFGSSKMPTLKEVHTRLQDAGIMATMGFTDEEYERLNDAIDHDRDLTYPQYALELIRSKYQLKHEVTGKEYETPQFACMRVAMEVGRYAGQWVTDKVAFTIRFYDHISQRRINIPTPYWTNSGTRLRGFASCCLITAGDSAGSLDAGKLIAGKMTQQSAGIGTHWMTRSINSPVRNGAVKHLGKLPCYQALSSVMGEFKQAGRGGAGTMYYSAMDPEVVDIQALKNPLTPLAKQNRALDYAMIYNQFFLDKVRNDEEVNLYSYDDAPALYHSQFSKNPNDYAAEYKRLEMLGVKPRKVMRAQDILAGALTESFETGRHYSFNATAVNAHTPLLEPIVQSNLCLTGDTMVKVRVDGKVTDISLKELVDSPNEFEILSHNIDKGTDEFKPVTAKAMTARNAKLMKITDPETGFSIRCTPDHKVYTTNRGYVEAKNLVSTDILKVM